MVTIKKANVGIFVRKLPHYREGIFERLLNNDSYNVNIYAGQKNPNIPAKELEEAKVNLFGKKIYYQKNISDIIEKDNLDIVIMMFSPYILSTILRPLLKGFRKYKFIAWTHGYFKGEGFDSFKNKFLRFVLKKCDGVLLYTEREAKMYLSRGFTRDEIFVSDNTLDTKKINEVKKNVSEKQIGKIKESYNIGDKKTLIFVGRLIKSKRIKILLKAIEHLNQKCKDDEYNLFIIGDGQQRNIVKEYVKSHSNINWPGKITQEEKLAPYLMSSDLFVMPGKTGLSINHAFSYGLPYITTDENIHAPEVYLLQENYNGEYFKGRDHIDLAEKISDIAECESKLEKYSENALNVIEEKYNIDNMENNFIEMFDSICSK